MSAPVPRPPKATPPRPRPPPPAARPRVPSSPPSPQRHGTAAPPRPPTRYLRRSRPRGVHRLAGHCGQRPTGAGAGAGIQAIRQRRRRGWSGWHCCRSCQPPLVTPSVFHVEACALFCALSHPPPASSVPRRFPGAARVARGATKPQDAHLPPPFIAAGLLTHAQVKPARQPLATPRCRRRCRRPSARPGRRRRIRV